MEDPEIKEKAVDSANLRISYIKESFDNPNHELDYARKLFLIENCIYGVDIQNIAVHHGFARSFINGISPIAKLQTFNAFPVFLCDFSFLFGSQFNVIKIHEFLVDILYFSIMLSTKILMPIFESIKAIL